MSKLSPKGRKIVREAYAVKDRAATLPDYGYVFIKAIDKAITDLKAGRFGAERLAEKMAAITDAFVFVSNNPHVYVYDVDTNAASSNNAFSSKVSDERKPRTNKDVKPSKLKTYYGRDGMRRANNARTQDLKRTVSRVTAEQYEANSQVTQTAREYDAYTLAVINRSNVKTDTNIFIEEFYTAKETAPTIQEAIDACILNGAESKAKREAVKVIRQVKSIS